MTIYATPAELAVHMGTAEPPALATVYLRRASSLVDGNLTARFGVDPEGWPIRPDQRAAVRDATLEQAEAWAVAGLDPRLGAAQLKRGVKSKSLAAGASVTYDDAKGQAELEALASGASLTGAAWGILAAVGLTSGRVYESSGGPDVVLVRTPYDLTTGRLTDGR